MVFGSAIIYSSSLVIVTSRCSFIRSVKVKIRCTLMTYIHHTLATSFSLSIYPRLSENPLFIKHTVFSEGHLVDESLDIQLSIQAVFVWMNFVKSGVNLFPLPLALNLLKYCQRITGLKETYFSFKFFNLCSTHSGLISRKHCRCFLGQWRWKQGLHGRPKYKTCALELKGGVFPGLEEP